VSDIQIPDSTGIANISTPIARHPRRELSLTVILLALIVCCVFAPSILFKQAYYWGDIGLFFLPLDQFLKVNLSVDRIPLWNPYLFCGAPYVGNPQVSVLYPSTLLLPFFPAVTAIMIAEAAHIFAAGLFFWFLARRGSLKLPYWPAFFSACIYMLCGYFVAKAQFPNMLAALAYVPLLLYTTELVVDQPSIRTSTQFGIALGLQLLAAHTQITVFTLYLIVAYGLWLFCRAPSIRRFGRIIAFAVLGGLLATGLSCEYWLPTAELIHASARQALSLHTANRFFLPWTQMSDLVLPHRYGSPMRGDWRAHGNYWETDNYIGILPFLLAVYGIFAGLQRSQESDVIRRQTWFWLLTVIMSTWLSLGSFGRLYRYAFDVLPALNAFHDPARLMLGTTVALALFAGYGLSSLLGHAKRERQMLIAAIVIVLSVFDLGHHVHSIYPMKAVAAIEAMSNASVPKMLKSELLYPGAGRIMMPDSQRAWQSFTTYKSYEQQDPLFLAQWPDTMSPCLGMTYGLREVGGYDPEYRKDSEELVSLAQDEVDPPITTLRVKAPPVSKHLTSYLASLGVQYLVTYRVGTMVVPGLQKVFQSNWTRKRRAVIVFENSAYHGRAMEYSHWTTASSQELAFKHLATGLNGTVAFDYASPIVEEISSAPSNASTQSSPAEFVTDTPDRIELLVPASTSPSVVVLADTLHPGWDVLVNDKPARMLRANVDQRAVLLPPVAGRTPQLVTFVYHPVDFLFGLYVSLLSLNIMLGCYIGTTSTRPVEKRKSDT
jgi:hypothetical protein